MNGCGDTDPMDSSFAARKKFAHMAQKHDTTESSSHLPGQRDLPNHNQPQARARVPGVRPRAPRPGRLRALTPGAGPLQAAGGRAPPRPRGLGSPPAQPCAPSPLALHGQPSRAREARALSCAARGAPGRVCTAHGRGCSPGAPTAFPSRSYGPAPVRFRRGWATPPVSSAHALPASTSAAAPSAEVGLGQAADLQRSPPRTPPPCPASAPAFPGT